jgi:hypothetical protein
MIFSFQEFWFAKGKSHCNSSSSSLIHAGTGFLLFFILQISVSNFAILQMVLQSIPIIDINANITHPSFPVYTMLFSREKRKEKRV